MKVIIENEVTAFLSRLAPEPRRNLIEAMRMLAKNKIETKALHGVLDGYYRIVSGRYRVIFYYRTGKSGPECVCEFAETRNIVYEVFSATVLARGY